MKYKPDKVSPPGETLREMLKIQKISQASLARQIKRPLKTINEIVKGKSALTPETAIQLEKALGVSAEFWVMREAAYRLSLARKPRRGK